MLTGNVRFFKRVCWWGEEFTFFCNWVGLGERGIVRGSRKSKTVCRLGKVLLFCPRWKIGIQGLDTKKVKAAQLFPKKNRNAGKKTNLALPVVLLQLVPSIGPFVLSAGCLRTAFSLLLATHDFFLYGNSCEAGEKYKCELIFQVISKIFGMTGFNLFLILRCRFFSKRPSFVILPSWLFVKL